MTSKPEIEIDGTAYGVVALEDLDEDARDRLRRLELVVLAYVDGGRGTGDESRSALRSAVAIIVDAPGSALDRLTEAQMLEILAVHGTLGGQIH